MVQMPAGIPVATFAIGEAGAANAALLAVATLSTGSDSLSRELAAKLDDFRQRQEDKVLSMQLARPE